MPEKKTYIPLSRPHFIGQEWKYLKECLDTGWVSSVGSYVQKFENNVASYVGSKFAVACVNGTSALHIALLIAGIKPNDEVIVPTLTFAAPAFAVKYCGAYPVFMDADEDYWQLDCQKLKSFLSDECIWKNRKLINKNTKRQIKAIIPVHVLGHPVDMDPIMELAQEFELTVIEDVAESIGAKYRNLMLGSIGHMGCFSFNGNKIITAGGGGIITTNQKDWAQRARYLTTQAKDDSAEYIHHEVGYNYRLTNLQAAIGVAQLECLEKNIKSKRAIGTRYDNAFKGIAGIRIPQKAPWAESIWWLYTVLIDRKKFGINSRALMSLMKSKEIETRPLWHPLHILKPFKDCYSYQISVAPKLYEGALSLPSSSSLTLKDQNRVIDAIKKAHLI